MNPLDNLKKNLVQIQESLKYHFNDGEILVLAFVHRSFVNEYKSLVSSHNERLEFLGDSVLGLIVSDYLYHRLPTYAEGKLSQLRSRVVDTSSCANYLKELELSHYILLGRGEKMHEGGIKTSIQADVFEALIGAIYLDGGLTAAKTFFLAHFKEALEEVIGTPARNYKAELQDYSQKKYQSPPVYQVVEETGPDHAKIFHVQVIVNGEEVGLGVGVSKKEAEQRAAFVALSKIDEVELGKDKDDLGV